MDNDPVGRAFDAWARHCALEGFVCQQPASTSGVVRHAGETYVELNNVRGTLAVYRVRPSGRLVRVDDWPAEVAPS